MAEKIWISIFLLFCFVPDTASLKIASMKNGDFADAYLQWFANHPDASASGKSLTLRLPSLDFYAPSGMSIYYGTDVTANVAFIHRLAKEIPKSGDRYVRPSFKEAIEMVPQFKERERELLSDHRPTLFVVTYPNWKKSKPQDEAVETLLKSIPAKSLRVLQVELTK